MYIKKKKKKAIEEMNKVARFYDKEGNRLILIDTKRSLNSDTWEKGYDVYYIHILGGDTDEELKKNVLITAKGLDYFYDIPNCIYGVIENPDKERNWRYYKYLYKEGYDSIYYYSFNPEKYYKSCKADLDSALNNYMYEVNRGKTMEKIFKK